MRRELFLQSTAFCLLVTALVFFNNKIIDTRFSSKVQPQIDLYKEQQRIDKSLKELNEINKKLDSLSESDLKVKECHSSNSNQQQMPSISTRVPSTRLKMFL